MKKRRFFCIIKTKDMNRRIKESTRLLLMTLVLLLCAGTGFTSCEEELGNEDVPLIPDINPEKDPDGALRQVIALLEEAQQEGSVVSISYTFNGKEHVSTFKRENNKYVLQAYPTRADGDNNPDDEFTPYLTLIGSDDNPVENELEDDEEEEWEPDEEGWLDGFGDDEDDEDDEDEDDEDDDDDEDEDDDDDDEDDEGEDDEDDEGDEGEGGSGSAARAATRAATRTFVDENGPASLDGYAKLGVPGNVTFGIRDSKGNDVVQTVITTKTGTALTAKDNTQEDVNSYEFESIYVNSTKTNTKKSTKSGTIRPTSIKLSKKSIKKPEGKYFYLSATVKPKNAVLQNPRWISSVDTILTIENLERNKDMVKNNRFKGKVRLIYYGKAEAIFAVNGLKATCPVESQKAPLKVKFPKITITNETEEIQIPYILQPAKTKVERMTWRIGKDGETTEFDDDGILKFVIPEEVKNTSFRVFVHVDSDRDFKKDASFKVNFSKKNGVNVSSFMLKESSVDLWIGDSVQLTPIVTPEDAEGYTINWSVKNGKKYVTVNNDGVVKGLSPGTATIQAKCEKLKYKLTATCKINVKAGDLYYETDSVTKYHNAAPFIIPLTNTGDGVVTYTSSNENVATVDSSTGKVTVQGTGEAIITASVEDKVTKKKHHYVTTSAYYVLTVKARKSVVNDPNDYGKGDNPF